MCSSVQVPIQFDVLRFASVLLHPRRAGDPVEQIAPAADNRGRRRGGRGCGTPPKLAHERTPAAVLEAQHAFVGSGHVAAVGVVLPARGAAGAGVGGRRRCLAGAAAGGYGQAYPGVLNHWAALSGDLHDVTDAFNAPKTLAICVRAARAVDNILRGVSDGADGREEVLVWFLRTVDRFRSLFSGTSEDGKNALSRRAASGLGVLSGGLMSRNETSSGKLMEREGKDVEDRGNRVRNSVPFRVLFSRGRPHRGGAELVFERCRSKKQVSVATL